MSHPPALAVNPIPESDLVDEDLRPKATDMRGETITTREPNIMTDAMGRERRAGGARIQTLRERGDTAP
jgi:hypothetical protein